MLRHHRGDLDPLGAPLSAITSASSAIAAATAVSGAARPVPPLARMRAWYQAELDRRMEVSLDGDSASLFRHPAVPAPPADRRAWTRRASPPAIRASPTPSEVVVSCSASVQAADRSLPRSQPRATPAAHAAQPPTLAADGRAAATRPGDRPRSPPPTPPERRRPRHGCRDQHSASDQHTVARIETGHGLAEIQPNALRETAATSRTWTSPATASSWFHRTAAACQSTDASAVSPTEPESAGPSRTDRRSSGAQRHLMLIEQFRSA